MIKFDAKKVDLETSAQELCSARSITVFVLWDLVGPFNFSHTRLRKMNIFAKGLLKHVLMEGLAVSHTQCGDNDL